MYNYDIKEFIMEDGSKKYEVTKYRYGEGIYMRRRIEGCSKRYLEKVNAEAMEEAKKIRRIDFEVEIPSNIQSMEMLTQFLKGTTVKEVNNYSISL